MPKYINHGEQKTEIARAALRVISRMGIESATMRGIATEAGCTTGLLTHYFRSRQDLIGHALDQAHRDFFRQLDRTITQADNGRHALLNALVIMSNVPTHTDQSVLFREMATALGDPNAQQRLSKLYVDVEKRLKGQVARAAADGSLVTAQSARDLVQSLTATAEGLYMAAIARPQTFTGPRRQALLDATLNAAATTQHSKQEAG